MSAHEARYRLNIMLLGMRNWKIVASSDGRKNERIRPVPAWIGFPRPLFSVVSDARVVRRVKVYVSSETFPSGWYVGIICVWATCIMFWIALTQLYFLKKSISCVAL